jgi:prolyl-tRNA editing enzyme YbaK/EbsC (Cys-tRNA(Pro) deacylase)
MSPLSESAQKVQAALQSKGFAHQVQEMAATTRTSAEAAAAVGCTVGQIAKSLIFCGKSSQQAILVVASGANRVDEKKITALLGEKIEKADVDFVRAQTGFVIGGVPPLGHPQPLRTLIDQDLLAFAEIWAAAGTPNAVFKLLPSELVAMTNGLVADVRQADKVEK